MLQMCLITAKILSKKILIVKADAIINIIFFISFNKAFRGLTKTR